MTTTRFTCFNCGWEENASPLNPRWTIGLDKRSNIVDLCDLCEPLFERDGGNHFTRKRSKERNDNET